VIQNARVAMALLTADLRAACPLSKDFEFLGMPRMIDDIQAGNLDFATHNYQPRRPREADFCEISYYVERELDSPDVSLYRRRNPTIALDPLSGGRRELIAHGLRGVSFEYYDGWDWYDTWGEINPDRKAKKTELTPMNLSGMPEAVRITLQFNPDPKASKARLQKSDTRIQTTEIENEQPPMVFETTVRLNLAAASQSGFSRSSGTDGTETSGQAAPPANGRQAQ